MFTGKEKAWMAFAVALVTQAVALVVSELPDDPALSMIKWWLIIIGGVVGIVGTTAGVYAIPNTPTPPVEAPSTVVSAPQTDPKRVPLPAPTVIPVAPVAPTAAPVPASAGVPAVAPGP